MKKLWTAIASVAIGPQAAHAVQARARPNRPVTQTRKITADRGR